MNHDTQARELLAAAVIATKPVCAELAEVIAADRYDVNDFVTAPTAIAATPALALCCATIRARAEKGEG